MLMQNQVTRRQALLLVAGLVCLLGNTVAVADAGDRPNLVMFMTDDQGYGDAGFMGHPHLKTPVLDEMAEGGLRLDRFYSASPVCSPTRVSVLTGRHPNRMGVFRHGHALRPQERSVATLLREHGYRTGFFGKWHIGSVQAARPTSPDGHGFQRWTAAPNYYVNDPWMSRDGQAVQLTGESSMVTVEQALPFIEESVRAEEPFVVFIWTGSPHTPHEAADELRELYADHPEPVANYYGEITGIDRALGALRDRLRELEIERDTVVWFTSDNGGQPPGDNRDLRGAKGQLWEGGIRVPTVIEWPGRIERSVSDVPAGTVDVLPTFLDLAGVPVPDDRPLDGVSLVPMLEGRMPQRPEPMGFWHNTAVDGHLMYSDRIVRELHELQQAGKQAVVNEGQLNGPEQDYQQLEERPGTGAWIDGDWKLHRRGGEYLLFNLEADPGEQENVLDAHPDRAEHMKQDLRAWEEAVIESARGGDY